MKHFRFLHLLVLALLILVPACQQPVETTAPDPETATPAAPAVESEPAPEPAAAAEPESLPTSATAAMTEAALDEKEAVESAAMPADHWLAGTSDELDMLPAIIAPDAPRELLAENGPAYLERIGQTRVLHLKGTHREMGAQHGTLMKDEILEAANMIRFIGNAAWSNDYSASIREAWARTSPHIPQKYKDEIEGMAEATGLPVEEVQDFTIFPELFHCSGFAIWGKATAGGQLMHGRVLDYMRDAGLDKFALLIIHEPAEGNAFVNVGYSGLIGSVTGMNMNQVAVGEMGGSGAEQWDGMPMSLLVRECLESGNTLEEAKAIMESTPRTCQYYYVISDGKANDGRGGAVGVAAEPDFIQFVEPNQSVPQLPRAVEDAVLMSAGDRYNCLVDRVEKIYGEITPQQALDIMARGVAMKSNMHNALFLPKSLELWVAHSTVEEPASNRPYTHYDLKELVNTRPGA